MLPAFSLIVYSLLKPGPMPVPSSVVTKLAPAKARPFADTLVDLVPQNPLTEAVNAYAPSYPGGGLVGVMVFSTQASSLWAGISDC